MSSNNTCSKNTFVRNSGILSGATYFRPYGYCWFFQNSNQDFRNDVVEMIDATVFVVSSESGEGNNFNSAFIGLL